MINKPENPPAFPDPCNAHPGAHPPDCEKGMTLRDYFAAKALQEAIRIEESRHKNSEVLAYGDYPARSARRAYDIADAMLKERGKA